MRSLRAAPHRTRTDAPLHARACHRKQAHRSPEAAGLLHPVRASANEGGGPVGSSDDPELRERVKQLKRMFYQDTAPSGRGADGGAVSSGPAPVATAAQEHPTPAPAHLIKDLPLWREVQPILPYSQSMVDAACLQRLLHVQTPGLVHMFEVIFSRGRPWHFGSLYLPTDGTESSTPGGRQSGLCAGSTAPLIGVLMEATRAIRLQDGGLFILVTATRRFQMRRCRAEFPFPRADVAIFPDAEVLNLHHTAALHAACDAAADSDDEAGTDAARRLSAAAASGPEDARRLSSDYPFPACGSEDIGIEDVMMAAAEGAVAAAAAEAIAWEEFEFAVARRQQWDEMPREGADGTETHFLMTWVMDEGVSKVVPLPDGEVVGRWDLSAMQAKAAAAAQEALAQAVLEEVHDPGQSGADMRSIGSSGTTTSRRSAESYEDVPLISREELGLTGAPEHDMAVLERRLWEQLDLVAGLTLKLRKQRYSLPLGLLQLRPPPMTRQQTSPESSGGAHPYHLAASDGLDTVADKAWPLFRRVEKLSWAVPSVFLDIGSRKQQGVLECMSVVARLWVSLTLIKEAVSELAVEAAVKGMVEDN